jgi:DNA repair exonuclease SbcCD ATPase subunit
MRRPTVSAWVTNLFALERGERLEQLFSLGAALREAQASLSGDTLRRLDEQRRQVIAALAAEAAALAAQRGQAVPAQVVADVEQTLYAALADEDAAAAVKSARLTTALSYTGFGEADMAAGARAGRDRRAGRGARATEVEQPAAAAEADAEVEAGAEAEAEAARRARAREALQAAERAFETAAEAAARARRRLADGRAEHDQRVRAVEELETQLADARSLVDDAEREVDGAETEVEEAQAALERAEAALEDARAAAD